jgi:hypothetical protein
MVFIFFATKWSWNKHKIWSIVKSFTINDTTILYFIFTKKIAFLLEYNIWLSSDEFLKENYNSPLDSVILLLDMSYNKYNINKNVLDHIQYMWNKILKATNTIVTNILIASITMSIPTTQQNIINIQHNFPFSHPNITKKIK